MQDETVTIRITQSNLEVTEGETYEAIQDDDGFLIRDGIFIPDGEAEVVA